MKTTAWVLTAVSIVVLILAQLARAQCMSDSKDPDVMCGPRSLLAICKSLGVKTDITELRVLSAFDEKLGTSMLGLEEAARAKGLQTEAMKIGTQELANSTAMAIAHLWGDHFVVVERADGGGLRVASPPNDPVVMSQDAFSQKYSGFALLVAKNVDSLPKAKAGGPDLRADAYTYNFGFIEQGEHAERVFTLENKGTEDLVISGVETSCSCTQSSLPAGTRIPPGGKTCLTVGFDSIGREGGQSQIVYVHSNDPVSPTVQLRIGGIVKPPYLSVSARSLCLGVARKHAGTTAEFFIADPGDNSLLVSKVASDSQFLKITLTHDDTQGLVYHVRAELQPGAPLGQSKSNITIYSNHPQEPVVEIPVTAEVVGDIEVFPRQFFLGVVERGQNASKKITLSTTSDKPLSIKGIDNACEYVIVTASPKVNGKEYTITATLKGTAPVGLTKQVVVIHTNDPDQPEISVPLYALIEK